MAATNSELGSINTTYGPMMKDIQTQIAEEVTRQSSDANNQIMMKVVLEYFQRERQPAQPSGLQDLVQLKLMQSLQSNCSTPVAPKIPQAYMVEVMEEESLETTDFIAIRSDSSRDTSMVIAERSRRFAQHPQLFSAPKLEESKSALNDDISRSSTTPYPSNSGF